MTSMASEAASSSSSVSNSFTYQVFLSFRGEDTRSHFTGNLYNALDKKGITTFMDPKLPKGENVAAELRKAIKESEVSIIVFSENYADSKWCLDELVEILQRKASNQQKVRPIFYKVSPSDVRRQSGNFGDAFNKLDQASENEDSIPKWRKALTDAANLAGWHFSDGESEYEFISKIVKEMSDNILIPSYDIVVAKYPIGIDSPRQAIEKLLDMEKDNVGMLGIWGAGGIGKSTVAKAVFNSIKRNFEASCFLEDVRSNSIPHGGLDKLHQTLLSDMGVSSMRMMQRKRVLIVLDDVSDQKQLEKLAPSIDNFGPGSRIIITTRDERVLTIHEVGLKYDVKLLDDDQALKLFSRHAFKKDGPIEGHHEVTQRAVSYAGGLPLALIVLGSHMFDRSKEEWEAILDSCKGDHRTDIQKVLKISYDALGDDLKEFFLDIACFFKGEDISEVQPILEACHEDLKAVIGLKLLQEKSLIRIDRVVDGYEVLWMHDLIEEMGKGIGKSSRLWNWDDLDRALTDNTATERLKGIHIPCRSPFFTDHPSMFLNANSFSKMVNLKYISVRDGLKQLPKLNIDYLSNELRWVEWSGCPLHSFPTNFSPRKLVRLYISNSAITRLWEGRQNLPALKYFRLDRCESLVELPDFTGTPNLETLNLFKCSSLVEMHHSVGALHKLVTLDVTVCRKLTAPPTFSGNMRMQSLDIRGCNLSECDFLKTLDCLDTLTCLDLSDNNIVSLPECISKFLKLEKLYLRECKRLQKVPELPPNLVEVDASNCGSLERIWKLSETLERKHIRWISLWNCCNLGFNRFSMEGLLVNNIQANSQFVVLFPGTITAEDAKWLHCWKAVALPEEEEEEEGGGGEEEEEDYRCSITISKDLKWENLGLAVIAESAKDMYFEYKRKIFINGVSICVDHNELLYDSEGSSDHVLVEYIPLTVEMKTRVDNQKDYSSLPHYHCLVEFNLHLPYHPLKGIGVHLVCKESKDDENSPPSQQKRPLRGDDDASDFPELSDPPQPKRHRRTNSV